MEHIHDINDSGKPYVINPVSRSIITPETGESVLVRYDHDSSRLKFRIPRIIENHDMSLADTVEIHYINIDGSDKTRYNKDIYLVTDIHVDDSDSNYASFTWLVHRNATLFAGTLVFLVRFICRNDAHEVIYTWSTAEYYKIPVLNGMNNGTEIMEEYSDILEEWRRSLITSGLVTTDRIDRLESDVAKKAENVRLHTDGEYVWLDDETKEPIDYATIHDIISNPNNMVEMVYAGAAVMRLTANMDEGTDADAKIIEFYGTYKFENELHFVGVIIDGHSNVRFEDDRVPRGEDIVNDVLEALPIWNGGNY